MKNIGKYFLIVLSTAVIFLFGFDFKDNKQPNTLYKVYLDKELIGTIKSREELEDYINNQANVIRENLKKYNLRINAIEKLKKYSNTGEVYAYSDSEKVNYLISNKELFNISDSDIEDLKFYQQEKLYNISDLELQEMKAYVSKNEIYSHVENVYKPNGIEIKKIYTYENDILSTAEAYKKIVSKKSSSIAGYKFTIKSENNDEPDIVVYTLDTKIFSDAIEDLIKIFVNEDVYEKYKKDQQEQIITTGSIIDKIYIQEDITYKAVNVSVDEKIYTNSTDLSAYLLYGDTYTEKIVKVKHGDSIESLSNENQISVQEFLIFNKQYTSRDNLLVPNTDVVISTVDPKIQVVTEYYEVVDKDTKFEVQEVYDENLNQGSVMVTQEGKPGLERVSQNVKSINGNIAYVDPQGKEVIQSSVPKIINIGTRYIPNVGSTESWFWPTNPGYTLTSYYGYRLQVFEEGNFHSGLDIAGTGYGSPVYASNNGVIEVRKYVYDLGYHIIINHNNGFYTVYGHMAGFNPEYSLGSTVSRGDIIGYVGSTGWSTGPHLHFEIRTCIRWSCHTNPLPFLYR